MQRVQAEISSKGRFSTPSENGSFSRHPLQLPVVRCAIQRLLQVRDPQESSLDREERALWSLRREV